MTEEMVTGDILDESANEGLVEDKDSGAGEGAGLSRGGFDEEPLDERVDRDASILEEQPTALNGEISGDLASEIAPRIKVALDWIELEGALENNSPELHSFLNTATGDVVRIFEGGENAETRLKQAEASPDYLYIEPVSSREQYRWMEEFIETVEEPTLKDKLNIAIDGKGAFRRFKDVLVGYPAERENWFIKRSAQLRAHINNWLASKNVEAVNVSPWEEAGHGVEAEVEPRQEDLDGRIRSSGTTDLRTTAHDVLDLVPSRELPTAVAFLEFLRNRRGYRRNRFG